MNFPHLLFNFDIPFLSQTDLEAALKRHLFTETQEFNGIVELYEIDKIILQPIDEGRQKDYYAEIRGQ